MQNKRIQSKPISKAYKSLQQAVRNFVRIVKSRVIRMRSIRGNYRSIWELPPRLLETKRSIKKFGLFSVIFSNLSYNLNSK